MTEIGQVVEIKGMDAIVRIERTPACGKCRGCQLSDKNGDILLTIPNLLGAQVGDFVQIDLESTQILKASAIAYLIPLLALIAGIVAGYLAAPSFDMNPELLGAIGGILLTGISFWGIKKAEPILKKDNSFSPKMVSVINHIKRSE